MSEAVMALLGVVLGLGFSIYKDVILDRRASKKQAEQLAVYVICQLERFVSGCKDVAADDGYNPLSTQGIAYVQAQSPEFAIDFELIGWKFLPSGLLYRIVSLPNEIYEANSVFKSAYDFDSAPEYENAFSTRRYLFAKLGLEASSLISALRKEYKIPTRLLVDSNAVEYMEKVKSQFELDKARTP